MKKIMMILSGLMLVVFMGACSSGESNTKSSEAASSSTSSSVASSSTTSEVSQSTVASTSSYVVESSSEVQNVNLDENGVLIKYPYTLDFEDATYKILSTQRTEGSMTGDPILVIEMEFTNKGNQPNSPYMSFITNFDVQQTDGTTTTSLNGANSQMGNLEDQEAVKMGDANVNAGKTVKAIIGYTLEYSDQEAVFILRSSQITGENKGFIIK